MKSVVPKNVLSTGGKVWLSRGGENLLGESHANLLEQIALTGSITHAAAAAGISYRTAWSLVDRLNGLAGQAVVERTAGGRSGGGTHLTPYGADLLKAYQVLQKKHERYVEGLRAGIEDFNGFRRIARGMSLKTSARNQLFATVERIKLTGLEAEVTLALKGDKGSRDKLTSRITRRSAEDLGIRKGNEVYALIKANWVMLAAQVGKTKGSVPGKSAPASTSSNRLQGIFEEIIREGDRVEASIRLKGGEVLWTTFSASCVKGVSLEIRAAVDVMIDSTHVILGVTDVPRF